MSHRNILGLTQVFPVLLGKPFILTVAQVGPMWLCLFWRVLTTTPKLEMESFPVGQFSVNFGSQKNNQKDGPAYLEENYWPFIGIRT